MMEQDNRPISDEALANEIRAIYRTDCSGAEKSIEAYLQGKLQKYPPGERRSVVQRLACGFQEDSPGSRQDVALGQEEFPRFFSLLLGCNVSAADLSSAEVMERLARSLNTVFDTLNKTIAVINSNLLGRKGELETIRHLIGSDLEAAGGGQSLQAYIDQIQDAFLIAHRGFQQATHVEVEKILAALDPARLAAADDGFFKYGPFRKAEQFEIYMEKYQAVREWFDSGRFKEDLLRDFENICGKEYTRQARGTPWRK